jgi:hypothetical protein
MGDLVVLLLVGAVFAALVGYVAMCDRIVGPTDTGPTDTGPTDTGPADARRELPEADRVRR